MSSDVPNTIILDTKNIAFDNIGYHQSFLKYTDIAILETAKKSGFKNNKSSTKKTKEASDTTLVATFGII